MTGILVFILRILLALSLYLFLAWAVFTIWSELKLNTQMIGLKRAPLITLAPLDFSDQNRQDFSTSEIIIGRDPNCDYFLPNDTVSTHHARLSFHHNHWWLEDLQSTNGTFLNNEAVLTPTVIISGDKIRCGRINFRITIQPKN